MKWRIILAMFLTVVAIFLWRISTSEILPANFEECVRKSGRVMESYPRKCSFKGEIFAEEIGNELEKINLITISFPRPNSVIASPIIITGSARGYWFFEADFPVELVDENGKTVAFAIATALDDWMTEDFVPFSAELKFEKPSTKMGKLILHKDNPSGLPEHDDSLWLPVIFD